MYDTIKVPYGKRGMLTVTIMTDVEAHSILSERPDMWQHLVNQMRQELVQMAEEAPRGVVRRG